MDTSDWKYVVYCGPPGERMHETHDTWQAMRDSVLAQYPRAEFVETGPFKIFWFVHEDIADAFDSIHNEWIGRRCVGIVNKLPADLAAVKAAGELSMDELWAQLEQRFNVTLVEPPEDDD